MAGNSTTGIGLGEADIKTTNLKGDISLLTAQPYYRPSFASQSQWCYWLQGDGYYEIESGETGTFICDGSNNDGKSEFHQGAEDFYNPNTGIITARNLFDVYTIRFSMNVNYFGISTNIMLIFNAIQNDQSYRELFRISKRLFLGSAEYFSSETCLFFGPTAFRNGVIMRIENPGLVPIQISEGQILIREG